MNKRIVTVWLSAIAFFPVFTLLLMNQPSYAKDPARKEFSACEIKRTKPFNSTLLFKNRKFADGNKRYSADIYKSNSSSKNPKFISYYYNLKDNGKIIANFQFDYKSVKPNNNSNSTQTQLPSPNSNKIVWNTTFTACGPRPADQSYPVLSYLFYDTVIGIKINGYRSPLDLGQVITPNPIKLVSVINQLDGPDFGN